MTSREFDIILYGATGFAGHLVAAYLSEAAPDNARIALAGRDPSKIRSLQLRLGPRAAGWNAIHANANDPTTLSAMAKRTRVLLTAVGPFADYGLPLVEACAREGTDYADLTGDALFVRNSIDRYNDLALKTGTRIVHSCGFDSVPSDLSIYLTYLQAASDKAGELTEATLVCTTRGALSGGTVASGRSQMKALAANPWLRRIVDDPYALSGAREREPNLGTQSDVALSPANTVDAALDGWVATFLMAPFNTRIVRRSNSLIEWAYGRNFRYRELMRIEGRLAPVRAAAVTAAMWTKQRLGPALHRGFGSWIVDRLVPKPGTGPDAATRERGFFTMQTFTRTVSGSRYVTTFAAQGDPGYKATAVIFGEAGLCLAFDREEISKTVGVVTPATVMAEPLARRLREAGMTITIERRQA